MQLALSVAFILRNICIVEDVNPEKGMYWRGFPGVVPKRVVADDNVLMNHEGEEIGCPHYVATENARDEPEEKC